MKKVLSLITFVALTSFSNAQDYYHGIGVSYLYYIGTTSYSAPGLEATETVVSGVPGVTYKATLAFEAGKESYFGISSYPTIGLSLNAGNNSLGYQIPIVAEYYTNEPSEAGFIGGAGFSYGFASADNVNDFGGSSGGTTFGPMLSAGGQFNLKDKLIGVRASYTYGINKIKGLPEGTIVNRDSKSMISLGIYYLFGN